MRRVRYAVACSLDGYIAGPNDEFDWIVHDPEIDFETIFAQFDVFLIGARTFELMVRHGQSEMPGKRIYIFSHSLRQEDYPHVTIVREDAAARVRALREEDGKDIWLFGGGELFRTLLEAGLVDTVEVALIPVLLARGIPLLPAVAMRTKLRLTSHRVYKSGTVALEYEIV